MFSLGKSRATPLKYAAFAIVSITMFLPIGLQAQDSLTARAHLLRLCSDSFAGRGYVAFGKNEEGVIKAGKWIERQLVAMPGMKPMFAEKYSRPFSQTVNTFPFQAKLIINKKTELRPGIDWQPVPESGGTRGMNRYILIKPGADQYERLLRGKEVFIGGKQHALVLSNDQRKELKQAGQWEYVMNNGPGAIILLAGKKLVWSVAARQEKIPIIEIRDSAALSLNKTIKLNLTARKVKMEPRNVGAWVRGTREPDKIILFTAHYDHLGMLGQKTFFPGANDNAGGVSMVLQLATYYAANPPAYSVGFVLFAGEEAGLLGSFDFVKSPPVPLSEIVSLINLDLVTTGKGAVVVNGTLFPETLALLRELNESGGYLPEGLRERGKAANSDHYPFSEEGVRAIFIYLSGAYPHYHDPEDTADKPKLDGFVPLTELLKAYIERLTR